MQFLSLCQKFREDYQLSSVDYLKLLSLYPIYKMRFWYHNKEGAKKRLASEFFCRIKFLAPIKIKVYMSSFSRHVVLPVWPTVAGMDILLEVFFEHAYRFSEQPDADLYIDAGANVGYAALYICGTKSIKRALLIEANPQLHPALDIIVETLVENGVETHVARGALTGEPKEVSFMITERDLDGHIAGALEESQSTAEKITVAGKTLSDWLEESGFQTDSATKLLKMDIEGSEYELLEKTPDAIFSADYIVAELHGPRERRDQFIAPLEERHKVLKREFFPSCEEMEIMHSMRR